MFQRQVAPNKQQIMCSRSFGNPILHLAGLQEAVTSYATRTAEKLRRQSSLAGALHVFISTSPFREKDPRYSQGLTIPMPEASSDTRKLVAFALWGLKQIYRPGYRYAKAGVLLRDLAPLSSQQHSLFADEETQQESSRLMQTVDTINRRMGKDSVFLSGAGIRKDWRMKQGNKSPCYTTRWDELLVVRC
jgi:DNA polymerase V